MININKKICENIEGHNLRIKHGKTLKNHLWVKQLKNYKLSTV